MNIDYDGKPKFERPRKLTEVESLPQFIDKPPISIPTDERAVETDILFTNLAKAYIKGNVVLDALSKMEPAHSIPIDEAADAVRAAAIRLDKEISINGSIITYGMYQRAIDIVLGKKWEIRLETVSAKIPASIVEEDRKVSNILSGSPSGLLKEFIEQNGIVTTIIGMLTISPFQTVIFQSLGVEEAAKVVQSSQIPAGVALFLELGIKAEKILAILKASKLSTPITENQINELDRSEEARATALQSIGIDYQEFKASQEFQDSQNIISYVADYYKRYGGLLTPNGYLTIDHWIAYLQVAQNQQTIRDALDNSHKYSPKFREIRNEKANTETTTQNIFANGDKPHSNILSQLAGVTYSLTEHSNTIYDDIINVFSYQITDQELCCLIEVFGKLGNPETMLAIASMLRILATGLSDITARLQNVLNVQLGNLAQDALYSLISNINEFYDKIVSKVAKAFTINVDGLEHCTGMLTMGWAITHAISLLFDNLNSLIREISSVIGNSGVQSSPWSNSADRRHLLGIARLLEVIATRLSFAERCSSKNKNSNPAQITSNTDSKDFDQALFSILESRQPTIAISEKDKLRHFNNLPSKTSDRLKFSYGINSSQNNEINKPCSYKENSQRIDDLVTNLNSTIKEAFNG